MSQNNSEIVLPHVCNDFVTIFWSIISRNWTQFLETVGGSLLLLLHYYYTAAHYYHSVSETMVTNQSSLWDQFKFCLSCVTDFMTGSHGLIDIWMWAAFGPWLKLWTSLTYVIISTIRRGQALRESVQMLQQCKNWMLKK